MRFKIRILDNIDENHLTTPIKTQTEESPNLTTSTTNKQQVKKLKGIMKIQRMVLALKNFHIFKPENQELTEKQYNTTITQDQMEMLDNKPKDQTNQGIDFPIQEIYNYIVQEKVNNSMDIEKQQVQQENSQQLEQIDNQLEKNHNQINTDQDQQKIFISQECFQTQEYQIQVDNAQNNVLLQEIQVDNTQTHTSLCQPQENQIVVDILENHISQCQTQENQVQRETLENHLSQYQTQDNQNQQETLENNLSQFQSYENQKMVNQLENQCQQDNQILVNTLENQCQTQENQIMVNNLENQCQTQENQIMVNNLENHISCQTQEKQTQVDFPQYNTSECQTEIFDNPVQIPQKEDIETQTVQIYIDSQIQCEIDIEEKLVSVKQQIIESMEKQKLLCYRGELGQLNEITQIYSSISVGQFQKIIKDPFKLFNKLYYQMHED